MTESEPLRTPILATKNSKPHIPSQSEASGESTASHKDHLSQPVFVKRKFDQVSQEEERECGRISSQAEIASRK